MLIIGRALDGRPGTFLVSFGLFSVGLLVGMLRTRRHRSWSPTSWSNSTRHPILDPPRRLLARTLGDPSLQLVYWLPDRDSYVDEGGSPVELPDREQQRVRLAHAGEPLAALVYDPALPEDPKLLEAVSAAARLALDHSRLQADLRARLHDVRESRTAGERDRRANVAGSSATSTTGPSRRCSDSASPFGWRATEQGSDIDTRDALLAEIDAELQSAVEELRTLARGVHPAVLSDEGLEPALTALPARRTAIPTGLHCECPNRLAGADRDRRAPRRLRGLARATRTSTPTPRAPSASTSRCSTGTP